MRFAKITLYVAVFDHFTSIEGEPIPFDTYGYVMGELGPAFENDEDLILLDAFSEDMKLVPTRDLQA
jgi:hypothetical protein